MKRRNLLAGLTPGPGRGCEYSTTILESQNHSVAGPPAATHRAHAGATGSIECRPVAFPFARDSHVYLTGLTKFKPAMAAGAPLPLPLPGRRAPRAGRRTARGPRFAYPRR